MNQFGDQLKEWRRIRGVSQLSLAADAGVSQRHISFLETGRSNPSREMVLHLGSTLDIPRRECNTLLLAAGHAPTYAETALDDMGHVALMLDVILAAHDPHVAVIVDRHWNLLRANGTATAFMASLFADGPPDIPGPVNVMRLAFHPEGLRRRIVNWAHSGGALLRRLRRETAGRPHDHGLAKLYDEIVSYPGVSELPREARVDTTELVLPVVYDLDGDEVSMFTTVATVGDAQDLTLAELRIETLWPADPDSAALWNRTFGSM
ncbi:MAG: helix-turn-helix transcriptional regulator [Acidimicrobiia bacterium]|nr:helix-turn-helix transcriptional regulator [Acidimicrobiia bacterium]